MSVRQIKMCLMAGLCAGLCGLAAEDAQAFGGRLFGSTSTGVTDPCCSPAPPCAGAASGPGYVTQKVKVTEYVPTQVEETVTVMQQQVQTEKYTAYKTECVPETVTKQVTVNKQITETVNECRKVTERVPVQKTITVTEKVPVQKTITVYERVPVQKEITVMEKVAVQKTVTVTERRPVQKTVTVNEVHYKSVMVTESESKTVSHRVSVPTCVDLGPTLGDRLRKICDPCYTPCPRTANICKSEKVCETVCCPVTHCKKIAECVPVTKTICSYECVPVQKTICTYECVTKTITVPVTRTKCVPVCETVTCTVNVKKCVPYEATRQVTVCVPVKQTIKVCKMVPTVVEKEIRVPAPCAAAPCGPAAGAPCGPTCGNGCCEKASFLDRLRARLSSLGAHHCSAEACPAPCSTPCDPCAKKGLFSGGFFSGFGCKKHSDCECAAPAVAGAAAGCCK
jgi:hypothetical protein